MTRPLRDLFGLGALGRTASSARFVFTVAWAFSKLGFINFRASRFWLGLIFTVELGIDIVGRQKMPSVNFVFAPRFSPSLADWDANYLSLSDCDLSDSTTRSCLLCFTAVSWTIFREFDLGFT